jgi:hypothetical protein
LGAKRFTFEVSLRSVAAFAGSESLSARYRLTAINNIEAPAKFIAYRIGR